MLGLEMLDVAIGIVFVFLLLSLICTALNEWIESKLKLRAVDLEQGIRELLNDPKGNTIVQKLYDHPLVSSLFRTTYNPADIRIKKRSKDTRYSRGSDLPSYIPSKNFALALMDVLLPAQAATAATEAVSGGAAGAAAPLNDSLSLPDATGVRQPPAKPNPLQPLRNAVDGFTTNEHVRKALLTIIDAAGDDAGKAREGIENWYNSSMDRVSGWYKRRVQIILLWMGFAVAVVINADTFAIFKNLANDRPLRSAIVAQAQAFKDPTVDDSASNSKIQHNVNTLLQMGLPVGWNWKSDLNPKAVPNLNAIPELSFNGWFFKIIGWLVTGLAISLGAPFWFDILNKIMVIRSTVKPHEKSQEEASEDRQQKKK